MKKDLKMGAGIASAVALMLGASAPAQAADEPKEDAKSVKCVGGNSCKAKSECATADTSCAAQNSCKGKGWVTTKSEAACKKAGGHVATDKDKVGM